MLAGGVAGRVAGWLLVCPGLSPSRTEPERWREAYTESVIEVTMKMTADHVVALPSKVEELRGPNAVWLPMPPKAEATSPALPLCSSTTMMMKKQTTM